jgi:murein DD-endopeptidase MepM/ murein hydrolase activator NlpD
MRRLVPSLAAIAAALAVAATAAAGGPSGPVFTVVSSTPAATPPASAEVPNGDGIVLPPSYLARRESPGLPSQTLHGIWQRAGASYGIPWQVLAAINKIESNFGRNMGPSSAGAVGWMQFMPSTWMRWGVDADGDGVANPWDPEDAVFSAARYLAAAGARDDLARAVFAYNHADWYVQQVLDLAATFDSGDGGFAAGIGSSSADLRLAALQEQLGQARRDVSRAQRLIPRVQAAIGRLERKKFVLARRAGDATIPVRKFKELEAQIARIEHAKEQATGTLERRRADLDAAVARLQSLHDQIAAAAVAAPAAASGGSPQTIDGYVFPVGGGPSVVSVSHQHHDYPAADIAAPEGSPLFALADSIVMATYSSGKGRCGNGLKIHLQDGTEYTYCHLSYLEPEVVPGAMLTAGEPVGLVGQTGHATGPHLHLQLDPAASYPQLEPWFQAFAGVAFSWQDAPTPKRAAKARARVFTVVDDAGDPFAGGVITFNR